METSARFKSRSRQGREDAAQCGEENGFEYSARAWLKQGFSLGSPRRAERQCTISSFNARVIIVLKPKRMLIRKAGRISEDMPDAPAWYLALVTPALLRRQIKRQKHDR